jgi:hypothetical protein
MLKDMLGNELQEGDSVSIALAHPQATGQIAQLQNGGLIGGARKGQEVRPGFVTVHCAFQIPFDPMNPVLGTAVKVCDPKRPPQPKSEDTSSAVTLQ